MISRGPKAKCNVNLCLSLIPIRHKCQVVLQKQEDRGEPIGLGIYSYLPPGRIWHKGFFIEGIQETRKPRMSRDSCAVSHRFTMSEGQMLVFDSLSSRGQKAKWNVNLCLSLILLTRHECQAALWKTGGPGRACGFNVLKNLQCVLYI